MIFSSLSQVSYHTAMIIGYVALLKHVYRYIYLFRSSDWPTNWWSSSCPIWFEFTGNQRNAKCLFIVWQFNTVLFFFPVFFIHKFFFHYIFCCFYILIWAKHLLCVCIRGDICKRFHEKKIIKTKFFNLPNTNIT